MGGSWVFSLLVEGRLGLVALLLLVHASVVVERVCGERLASRGRFLSRLAIGLIWRLAPRSRARTYQGLRRGRLRGGLVG